MSFWSWNYHCASQGKKSREIWIVTKNVDLALSLSYNDFPPKMQKIMEICSRPQDIHPSQKHQTRRTKTIIRTNQLLLQHANGVEKSMKNKKMPGFGNWDPCFLIRYTHGITNIPIFHVYPGKKFRFCWFMYWIMPLLWHKKRAFLSLKTKVITLYLCSTYQKWK